MAIEMTPRPRKRIRKNPMAHCGQVTKLKSSQGIIAERKLISGDVMSRMPATTKTIANCNLIDAVVNAFYYGKRR